MSRLSIAFSALLLFASVAGAENPRVELVVEDHGSIVLELFEKEAPISVESFLEGVEDGFYDGTQFHRVIGDFMIQGGGFDSDGNLKPTDKNLRNEADNGLSNERGTVAMARKGDPHSASVQFFINLIDNGFLNHTAKTPRGWGYTVFGRVVEGMEVVDEIAAVPVRRGKLSEAVPVTPVVIERARVVGETEESEPAVEPNGR